MLNWLKPKTKPTAVPRHPGVDADGVLRAIPKALWNGANGDFLRQLGVSPDDENNIVPTQQGIDAEFGRRRVALDAFIARVNESAGGTYSVTPWAMLPWSVWNGEHAEFLLMQNMYPVDLWNTMLMPSDERSAAVLGLPKHLFGVPDGLDASAVRLIGEIRGELALVHAKVSETLARGDTSMLSPYNDAVEKARRDVRGVAHVLGSAVYGEPNYFKHREVFGSQLGWA